MNFCPLGTKVQREPQTVLQDRKEQRHVYLYLCKALAPNITQSKGDRHDLENESLKKVRQNNI